MSPVSQEGRLQAEGRKGMRLWLKGVLGCGTLCLLVAGALSAGVWAVQRRGALVMDRAWRTLRTTVDRLGTPEQALALYHANPALSETYPTEEAFLKASEGWRPRLGKVPANRPPLRVLLQDPRLVQVHRNLSDGHETMRMAYRFSDGAVIELESDQGQLTWLVVK